VLRWKRETGKFKFDEDNFCMKEYEDKACCKKTLRIM